MLRPVRFLSVLRQLKQVEKLQCQISASQTRCRSCYTAQSKLSQFFVRRHQSTSAEAAPSSADEAPSTAESEQPIPVPDVPGEEKTFSPKIKHIVDQIASLTLLEVADLNDCLKQTLNITSTPMMAAGPVAAAAPQEEEEEKKQEKVSFKVKLVKFDASKKVALIKEIKAQMTDMNLVQAKKFVESAPQVVKADLLKDEAEKLKDALVAVGAEVAIE